MPIIEIFTSILHGLVICIPFTIFVAVSFMINPRLWLHSLPADIQRRAQPKTPREILITRFVLLPIFILILPGLSLWSTVMIVKPLVSVAPSIPLVALITHLYIMWIVVHLWDLVVIDGISMALINPARPPIAGTENAAGWRDIKFHVRSFGKAVVNSAFFVVPAGIIVHFLV